MYVYIHMYVSIYLHRGVGGGDVGGGRRSETDEAGAARCVPGDTRDIHI